MIRRSYLPALALCTVVWGPASANSFSEVVDQGSYSATGDIYSQGMTAQGGPWAGDTYSQGMMMSNGQIYSLGMTLTFTQGNSSGSNSGNSTSGGYSSGIGSSSDQPGSNSTGGNSTAGNSTGGELGTDAFTNLSFDTSGPGGGSPEDPLTWASSDGYNGGNGNNGGSDDYGSYNPPSNDHHSVPEPTTLFLLAAAFLGLALDGRSRNFLSWRTP